MVDNDHGGEFHHKRNKIFRVKLDINYNSTMAIANLKTKNVIIFIDTSLIEIAILNRMSQ